jgi:CTD small phosphatase-like protein 2
VNIRPFARQTLSELSLHFELLLFTASQKAYADCILEYLDPNKQIFQHVLYRDSCVQTTQGNFIKDLRLLGRNLQDVVLVDNCASSFAYQVSYYLLFYLVD